MRHELDGGTTKCSCKSNLFSEKRVIIRKNRARQNQLAKKQNALNGVL